MNRDKNSMRGNPSLHRRVGIASTFGALPLLALLCGGCSSQRCYEDQDCKAPQICGPAGVCIFECSSDSDCGFGFQCREHHCVPHSTGTITCPDDMVNVAEVFCVDRYEASRPDATSTSAGTDSTCANSVAGVVPWQVRDNLAAETACATVGKRLCTPKEWKLACEGPDNTSYAYGNTYEPETCNGIDTFGRSNFHLTPTGTFAGCTNEWGLFDINGNLWEHVAGGSDQTVRGGAYNCGDSAALHRCDYVPGNWSPSARGFRCCLTPVASGDDGEPADADGADLDGGDRDGADPDGGDPIPSDAGGGCVGEEDGGDPVGDDSGDTGGGDTGGDTGGDAPDSGDGGTSSCGEPLIDGRDGKSYATVFLGGLCWMAQNLDIGAQINTTLQQTNQGQIDKYCYGNLADNCVTYGGLYQWNEAMQYSTTAGASGICPAGWRIPTDAQWKALEISQGMDPAVADQDNWRGPGVGTALKVGGTSGFDALLGGGVNSSGGSFNGPSYGYYWTSTLGTSFPWRRCLTSSSAFYPPDTVGRWQTWPGSYALSIRCVRNP